MKANHCPEFCSNAFMNLAAKFSTNNESNIGESTDVTLVTNGCGLGVSKPNKKRANNKGIEELIASLRTGEMSNWDQKRIENVLQGRFQKSTANRISMDIANFLHKDTSSHWKYLHEEAYKNGYRNEETNETIDWEALLHAPYSEFEECIKDRGTYRQLVFRILVLTTAPLKLIMHVSHFTTINSYLTPLFRIILVFVTCTARFITS